MTGKTTLVKALVEAGATYYSDEFAVLDKEGQVQPYPVPLSIRGNNGHPAPKTPVESRGGQTGVEHLIPAHVCSLPKREEVAPLIRMLAQDRLDLSCELPRPSL